MGGPSLSLTDTPSGSLLRTGMEFQPLGGAAITASNRDVVRPASPDFTCHCKLFTWLTTSLRSPFWPQSPYRFVERAVLLFIIVKSHHSKFRDGMPCGGGCQPQNCTKLPAAVICHTWSEATSEQQLYGLKLQMRHLFTRMAESWNMNRMGIFTQEKTDLEMFTSAGKWAEETPPLKSRTSTGSH